MQMQMCQHGIVLLSDLDGIPTYLSQGNSHQGEGEDDGTHVYYGSEYWIDEEIMWWRRMECVFEKV